MEDEEKNIDIIKYKKSQTNLLEKKDNLDTASNLPTNADNIDIDFKNIFGELLNEQEERLRKCSPYGNFKTWKICKIIGKYKTLIFYFIYQ